MGCDQPGRLRFFRKDLVTLSDPGEKRDTLSFDPVPVADSTLPFQPDLHRQVQDQIKIRAQSSRSHLVGSLHPVQIEAPTIPLVCEGGKVEPIGQYDLPIRQCGPDDISRSSFGHSKGVGVPNA